MNLRLINDEVKKENRILKEALRIYTHTCSRMCLSLHLVILKSSWLDCYLLTDIYTCDITTRLLQDSFIMAFVIVNGKYKSTSNDRI